jgi:hypothetical protein
MHSTAERSSIARQALHHIYDLGSSRFRPGTDALVCPACTLVQ